MTHIEIRGESRTSKVNVRRAIGALAAATVVGTAVAPEAALAALKAPGHVAEAVVSGVKQHHDAEKEQQEFSTPGIAGKLRAEHAPDILFTQVLPGDTGITIAKREGAKDISQVGSELNGQESGMLQPGDWVAIPLDQLEHPTQEQ